MNLRKERRKHLRTVTLAAHKKIWDLEFYKVNLGHERELLRKQHDRLREQTAGYEERIIKLKELIPDGAYQAWTNLKMAENLDQGAVDRFKESHQAVFPHIEEIDLCLAKLDGLTKDIDQLREQMDGIDNRISGEGGVNETIEASSTVIDLLKDHLKRV